MIKIKIPILWRLERWINKRKEISAEKPDRKTKAFSKHKRTYTVECPVCHTYKWFQRRNNRKCCNCGYRVHDSKQ